MTSPPLKYCMDTAGWITCRYYYGPETHPNLWTDLLSSLVAVGRLISPRQVKEELKDKDYFVSTWIQEHSALVVECNHAEEVLAAEITNKYPGLLRSKQKHIKPDPKSVGDPYVVALAERRGLIVITGELLKGQQQTIPYVCNQRKTCQARRVPFLLQNEKWTFSAAPRGALENGAFEE